jgi:hypothetical protein
MATALCKPRSSGEWLAGSCVWAVLGGYGWAATMWVAVSPTGWLHWLGLAAGAAWQGWVGWRLVAGGGPVLTRLPNGWLALAGWGWLLLLLLAGLLPQTLTLEVVLPSSGASLFDIH